MKKLAVFGLVAGAVLAVVLVVKDRSGSEEPVGTAAK